MGHNKSWQNIGTKVGNNHIDLPICILKAQIQVLHNQKTACYSVNVICDMAVSIPTMGMARYIQQMVI